MLRQLILTPLVAKIHQKFGSKQSPNKTIMLEGNSPDKGQRLLQLTVLAVLIVILWFLALPHYFKLMDKTVLTKVEANLSYLEQLQTMYRGIYGKYASTIDELAIEAPGLKEALGKKSSNSGWSYRVRLIDGGNCELIASKPEGSACLPARQGLASNKPEGDGAASDSRSHSQSRRNESGQFDSSPTEVVKRMGFDSQ